MRELILCLVLIGCKNSSDGSLVSKDTCAEVDWLTSRDGKSVTCRILWCGAYHGGPATLWCAENPPVEQPKDCP